MKSEIVPALISGILSVLMFVYAFFTSKEKGPILSNNYLFVSKEKQKKLDKKLEYRRVTIVFGLLGLIFLLLTMQILTIWTWLNYAMGIVVILLIGYVVKVTMDTVLNGPIE
ncbi:DUF3784 domain-containing protein [Anaerocolumna sp.]|uniref:DUF3784 domain-containing protein n=1 Tax=Anaerocolumna sp. TaxID=2041569 RepID=UPI0028AE0F53|nr:DUF3784 domain-containing protein [Anaerocolumna sp.]